MPPRENQCQGPRCRSQYPSDGELTFADLDERRAQAGDDIEFHLRVVPHGEFVVAVENDGYGGAFPEIARRCSADGGRFFSSLFVMEPEPRPWERRPGRRSNPIWRGRCAWRCWNSRPAYRIPEPYFLYRDVEGVSAVAVLFVGGDLDGPRPESAESSP